VVKHLSEEELGTLIKHEKSKRFAERLFFIRNLYAGEKVEIAAKKLGRCKTTGYLWLSRWDKHGLEGLKPAFGGGRPARLSSAQREEPKRKLQGRNHWTAKEVRQLIKDDFGQNYHLVSVSRILHSLGMRYGKPYPRDHRRPDDAEAKLTSSLEDALKTLDDIEAENLSQTRVVEGVVFGFLDECSPRSDANTVKLWSFEKCDIVKATSYRANTFGFYTPNGVSVMDFMENSKKESVCRFLGEIRRSNPEARIMLILDNFRSHRANMTVDKAEQLGITLTFLPPYSPDLNPIEQLWRCIKREVSTAFFRSEEEFLSIIKNAFSQLSRRLSFAANWIQKFLPQWFNHLCN